jgi:histidine triad (HIT) family protein
MDADKAWHHHRVQDDRRVFLQPGDQRCRPRSNAVFMSKVALHYEVRNDRYHGGRRMSNIMLPPADFCWFCRYLAGYAPCAFVARNDYVAAWVNIRQYERGALLVAPIRHLPTVFDLDADTLAAVYSEASRVGRAVVEAFGATGLNIFQNNGEHAGQSIPHHHVHVVPRYPTSERRRIFQQEEFTPVQWSTQLETARIVRAALRDGG